LKNFLNEMSDENNNIIQNHETQQTETQQTETQQTETQQTETHQTETQQTETQQTETHQTQQIDKHLDESDQSSYGKMILDFTEHTMNNLDDVIDPKLLQNELKLTYEEEDETNENIEREDNKNEKQQDDQIRTEQETIKLLDEVNYVLETKIKDDIMLVQKILEKKQYLIGLNQRLMEIRDRLQDLKNELTSK
jgi:hypothetical protein